VTDRPSIFNFIMIKPSHYDDEGYPLQWVRSAIPSNTLACLNGLADDCRKRNVLGDGVELKLDTYDETNRRIRPKKIIRQIERDGGRGLVALVGVQANQYPRAMDLARIFRNAGIQVAIGGFHVSGCISMLPELPEELKEAQRLGISLFAGEAEERRLDEVLLDAYRGELKPLYDHMKDLPALNDQPAPILPVKHIRRTAGSHSSIDLGRGCPYQCSFCTIINVQGRKSRFRTPEDLERAIRDNYVQGINRFFITDDNFARNRNWESFFDKLIWLREDQGFEIKFVIQVDTLCHKIENFIEKAGRAGVSRAFIGLENINPDSLLGAKKRQNKITDYRAMLQAWKRAGVMTYAGYIIGFPNDRRETVLRDIEIIKRELPIDILELFFLTPLPGSEDHKVLWEKGTWMDPDLNKYDLNHRVSHHPVMPDQEWEETYRAAWEAFYTPEHIETVMRRAVACDMSPGKAMFLSLWFLLCFKYEDVHPLEGGYLRLKYRKDRRSGMPLENPLLFYPKYLRHLVTNQLRMVYWALRMNLVRRKIKADPKRRDYMDLSLTPPDEEEFDELALFGETRGGQAAVEKRLKEDAAREAMKAATAAAAE
jgi:hypothetical protein